MASHNLRTPIANLISLGSLIDETKIEDPTTRMLYEKYKQTTLKLNDNVNDLLEILVIKNNREVPKKEINIDLAFRQVVESIDTYVADSGAEISTDFSAGNTVYFNPGYLHSILLNLLTNAIKYRNPEKKLQITIRTERSKNWLLLHFSDNGLGLDLEKYGDRIFGLYQKFHDHPDSKGLGLHIVASQVKAMGGKIKVKSQVNLGTTFTIHFKI
jgi:signal transduction histidine kinase